MHDYNLKLYFNNSDWAYVKVGADNCSFELTKDERLIKSFMDLDDVIRYSNTINIYISTGNESFEQLIF